jgi:hypothetical protein
MKDPEHLVRWLRWGADAPHGFQPVVVAIEVANRAAAAESLGESSLAQRLRERASRLEKGISRRETALPLAVLQKL